jgi:OmpA-OmpF porin, OOP family
MKAAVTILILIWTLVRPLAGACQENLVVNGSFELRNGCPNNPGSASIQRCQTWTALHGSPDYFHRCATGIYSVPQNFAGNQSPHDPLDSAYAGLATYTIHFAGGQESMSGVLLEPLTAGMKYRVRIKVSIATIYNYSSCCIGIAFTAPPHPPYSTNHSDVEFQIPVQEMNLGVWYQLDALYTAQGGELNFHVGNFRPDTESYPVVIGDTTNTAYNTAYFYIDDVEIYEDDTVTGVAGEASATIRAWYHGGQIKLQGLPTGAVAVLYDMAGRAVASGHGDMPAQGPAGLYVLRVMDAQGSVLHVQKLAGL